MSKDFSGNSDNSTLKTDAAVENDGPLEKGGGAAGIQEPSFPPHACHTRVARGLRAGFFVSPSQVVIPRWHLQSVAFDKGKI